MWTYHIATARFLENGVEQDYGHCYAGHGDCKNDPTKCGVHDMGPLPPGKYKIGNMSADPGGMGLYILPLFPLPGTNTLGRAGFFVHGDSMSHPGEASHGCIIAPLALRKVINISNDRTLEVLP